MKHLRFCIGLSASVLSIGLLFHSGPLTASGESKPFEAQSSAAFDSESRQLHQELESLRLRVEQLEKAQTAHAPNPHGGDSGERDRLLAEAREILAHFHEGKADAWKQAHGKIRELRLQVAAPLTDLQNRYTRSARLDEALAIRDAICFIRNPGSTVLTDPGVLRNTRETSRVLFFRVTGANSGSVYGTEIYTYDSALATAAVHAGVLEMGQTGVVKVTTLPSHPSYVGSTRHGITSSNWSSYPGYRVEALGDEDQDLNAGDLGEADYAKAPQPPDSIAPPKEKDIAVPEAQRASPTDPPVPWTPDAPSALPAEARVQLTHFTSAIAEIRTNARFRVSQLAHEALDRLGPIQDAHTRAARLEEAIAVRDRIRELTDNTDQR